VVRVALTIQGAVVLASLAVALAFRGALEDDLLSGSSVLFAVLCCSLVACGANFFARGFLAGRRQFGFYSWLLIIECVSRVLFALVAALGVGTDQDLVAVGIAAAPLAGLVVIPAALRRSGAVAEAPPGDVQLSVGRGGGFAAAVFVMMLSEQVILTSGPLFVRATNGVEAAGFVFNILLIARAPLVLFQAAATSLLPHLTRLLAIGDRAAAREFSRSVRLTALASAGVAAVVAVVVLAIGPWLMQAAFGTEYDYERVGLAIVAVGMGAYLVATTLSQAVLARGMARQAAVCWACSAAFFLLANIVVGGDEIRRVEVGFAATGFLLGTLLYTVYRRPWRAERVPVTPGSADELEARLAAAEEAFG
jgi:O-antigen/teichoic acid export membrane protein